MLTVAELRKALEDLPDDRTVVVSIYFNNDRPDRPLGYTTDQCSISTIRRIYDDRPNEVRLGITGEVPNP